eukprot:TRINITY_DN472_c0_g1_i1.p1 TRINITY_DN472_c0_g1~~TRINITY_DN472_c0_g1_i1.p1  ORF type:complete len:367 (+),score=56.41 TRINITY_DN472_c0_g1_i1:231-1331(+)
MSTIVSTRLNPHARLVHPSITSLSLPLRRNSMPSLTLHGDSDDLVSLHASILSGLRNNIVPEVYRESNGLGGVYFLKDKSNQPIAVFKPFDEESLPSPPSVSSTKSSIHSTLSLFHSEIKPGLLFGEGYLKEIAAYLLDSTHLHGVPPTTLFHHPISSSFPSTLIPKTGSLQRYVPHTCSAEDMGSGAFPVEEVQKIGILDCRILNSDRHMGNILVVKDGASLQLVPIDHAMSLPSDLSVGHFEWMSFSQSKKPFSQHMLDYISSLNPDADIHLLKEQLPLLRPECLTTLKICTIFLQKAAKKGFTLFQIGSMMTRYFDMDSPCVLEQVKEKTDDRIKKNKEGLQQEMCFWEILEEEINSALCAAL